MDLLDIEKRTGIKDSEIDEFIRKAEDVEAAIKGMASGTLKAEDVRIAGIDTPEEAAAKEAARLARLAEQTRKAEELRLKRKAEEKERWWNGAEFCRERKVRDENGNKVIQVHDETSEKERIRQRYTADYSRWNDWVPTDAATIEENEIKEAALEKEKNKEFEKNNAEFCNQFLEDMEQRNKATAKKQEDGEKARNNGNKRFQRKEWDLALKEYMDSLKLIPYDTKTLTNIAQVYIKLNQYDDAQEFLSRTLYLDYEHAKALSRRAFIEAERGDVATALLSAKEALSCIKKEKPPSKEEVDLTTQVRDLEILCKEQSDENKLLSVMQQLELKKAHGAKDKADPVVSPSTISAPSLPVSQNAAQLPPSAPTMASDKKTAVSTDFVAADELVPLLSTINTTNINFSQGALGARLEKATQRLSDNQMLRVYVRKNGLLDKCIALVTQLTTLDTMQIPLNDTSAKATSVLLHFLAAAVQGERASKLLLLPGGKTTLLLALRDKFVPLVDQPEVAYAALRVLYACCNDDTCTKTRDWVFSDTRLLGMVASTAGQVLTRNIGFAKPLLPAPSLAQAGNKQEETHSSTMLMGLAEIAARFVKEVTFSAAGKEALAKAPSDVCALAVTGLSATLHFTMTSELMVDPTTALDAMLSALGDEKPSLELKMALDKVTAELSTAKRPSFDTSLVVLEALQGCSQVENMRDFFAVELPWRRQKVAEAKQSKSGKEEPAQTCVEIIMHAGRAAPDLMATVLAVLMNACLDHDNGVRNAVQAHGGLELANEGLETLAKNSSCDSFSAAAWLLLCRQLGLLSRLAPLPKVQEQLYQLNIYRKLCRSLKTLTAHGSAPVAGSREAELHGHVVRTLAGLNKPSGEVLAAGVEEGIVQSLLSILPEPKKELNEYTPVSVTLMPTIKVSAVLIGNAARCLIPYADYATAQKLLYSDRKLIGIEKMICSMATCTEMPVRQNLSVLLAKGCRVPGIRDVVAHYRGIQMMQELQVQGQYKL